MSSGSACRFRARSLLAAAVALALAVAAAAERVDVNRATLAQLETVKGIGPELSEAILAERARSPFADWSDLVRRVRKIGPASAARLSAAGLTVDGRPYPAAPGASRAASATAASR